MGRGLWTVRVTRHGLWRRMPEYVVVVAAISHWRTAGLGITVILHAVGEARAYSVVVSQRREKNSRLCKVVLENFTTLSETENRSLQLALQEAVAATVLALTRTCLAARRCCLEVRCRQDCPSAVETSQACKHFDIVLTTQRYNCAASFHALDRATAPLRATSRLTLQRDDSRDEDAGDHGPSLHRSPSIAPKACLYSFLD
jgi:hypothetical protein